jgi:hypothetical protein
MEPLSIRITLIKIAFSDLKLNLQPGIMLLLNLTGLQKNNAIDLKIKIHFNSLGT